MPTSYSDSQPALLPATGIAARTADLLLRSNGGRCVLLRLPAPAVPADPTEQLGLATPQFQDVPLAPAVFRRARAVAPLNAPPRWELLVSATALANIAGNQQFSSTAAVIASAAGVLIDEVLYEVLSSTAGQVFGQPYVYRLVVRTPERDAI
jgi:hypothetical protein